MTDTEALKALVALAQEYRRLNDGTSSLRWARSAALRAFNRAALNAIPALERILASQGAAITQTAFNTWHPMETAPKDGRWVILYWAHEVTPGFYLDNSKTVYPWEGWSRGSGQVMLKGVPTSWMPFPTYP